MYNDTRGATKLFLRHEMVPRIEKSMEPLFVLKQFDVLWHFFDVRLDIH